MTRLQRLLFIGSILVLAASASIAEPSYDEDAVTADVRSAFASLVKAAEALDVDEYLNHFDRDRFTALNADGTVVHSFSEWEDAIGSQFAALEAYESLDFDRVKITALNADTAILVNEYRAIVLLASGETVSAKGGGTQVWRRTDDDWKLVNVSSSVRP